MSSQGFASGLSFPVPFTLKTKRGKCMYCKVLWYSCPCPPAAETFTSHYVPPCFSGGIFFVYRRYTQVGTVSFLLAAFLSLSCVRCQYKLELLPPPNCMDDQDGPRDGVFQTYFGLYFPQLSKHSLQD